MAKTPGTKLSIHEFREQLGDALDAVRSRDAKLTITRYGEAFAVVISLDEWNRLRGGRAGATTERVVPV